MAVYQPTAVTNGVLIVETDSQDATLREEGYLCSHKRYRSRTQNLIVVFITLFVTSLVTGGLGIYVGAQLVIGEEDPVHALITGVIGAVIWVVAGLVVGWIPLLGQLLVLFIYTWMVKRRYPGGWTEALKIAFIAWAVTMIVLLTLATLGYVTYEAIGVPFV